MDHRKHFYDRYTQAQSRFTSIDQARLRVQAEHKMLRPLIETHLPRDRSVRILDLGCGYGAFLLMLRDSGYKNLRGVDLSPEQVQLANELGASMVEHGTLESVLSEERGVALVTMFDVIEHLTRGEAITALQAIHAALVDDGTLVMRTPNIDSRLGTVLSFGDLTHEMHLNKYSALELFASLHFSSVEILEVPPVGGGIGAQITRKLVSPFQRISSALLHVSQGISRSATISTPNMLIVARR
jgi:2-polyprenyl-3-methyl-5-hydroxy-6-metoxy-1,4-benzoquinol methylase